jgi:hypothetical protein
MNTTDNTQPEFIGGPAPKTAGEDFTRSARAFIHAHHVMTLATTGDHYPWAAAVYYVFDDTAFYFFSSPASRHIQDACRTAGRAAAVISSESREWQMIQGLQMSGKVQEVTAVKEAVGVIQHYLKTFPFVRSFFKGMSLPGLSAFSKRFNAHLYGFRPESVYYLDNHIGFGFRERIDL